MSASAKTYSHLAEARRKPTEYEVVTSKLHYYGDKGFEIPTPLAAWYEKYQSGSPLQCPNWDLFCDPRETTYTKYTALQKAKEVHAEGVLRSLEESAYDAKLGEPCVALLQRTLPPLRYLFHGLQMAAAYLGQMAPSGRITIAGAFQAADEMRRIQRIAYRMAQLRLSRPHFGDDAADLWERDASWQPLRRTVEKLLVTYDWGEAFVASNLCVKPILDRFFMVQFPELAEAAGDFLLGELFFSLNEDCLWHAQWSAALVQLALQGHSGNLAALRRWVRRWFPVAEEGIVAFAASVGGSAPAAEAIAQSRNWLVEIGVAP